MDVEGRTSDFATQTTLRHGFEYGRGQQRTEAQQQEEHERLQLVEAAKESGRAERCDGACRAAGPEFEGDRAAERVAHHVWTLDAPSGKVCGQICCCGVHRMWCPGGVVGRF